MRRTSIAPLALAAVLVGIAVAPAHAQSTGYVTGIPGKDPADDDGITGWGPRFRPETTFSQPGTVPTPGDQAGWDYRRRTGRGPYDDVQAPLTTGALGNGAYEYGAPGPGYVDDEAPPPRATRRRPAGR